MRDFKENIQRAMEHAKQSELKLAQLSVAMISNGRQPAMLRWLVERWLCCGFEVVVAGNSRALRTLAEMARGEVFEGCPLVLLEVDTSPVAHGDGVAMALRAATRPFVLKTDDDVMPLPDGRRQWAELELEDGTIRGVELRDMRNRRVFDWAVRDRDGSFNVPYSREAGPTSYITGGCQLWSPAARAAVSYEGRPFRSGGDVAVCWDAMARGITLRPPAVAGPVLVHLDSRPDVIRDR